MSHAGFPSLFGLVLEDGHVPTFWLLLSYKIPPAPSSDYSQGLRLVLQGVKTNHQS